MIISVGFRVNSDRALQFRQWATNVLHDFAIRGYVLDKERLKNGAFFSKKYFDDLLAEIREIRASERTFYQKITDIYATAMDYDKNAETTKKFFATVQNKLHFAIHGQTAAELIVSRANAEKQHMGLSTWKNAPTGKIIKTDVSIAKNYLKENHENVEIAGTICGATYERQIAVEKLARAVDVVLVVGGYNSSNSKKLYGIAKAINERSYQIETKDMHYKKK
jgi:hypothetical protein